jgi:hypothetical protein
MKKLVSKYFYILLTGVAVLAVALRLYHMTYPIADWHSWRQADTAAVARNFLRFGIDPLHPRYDDLSNIQSGKDNPRGWRMVEFPLYQAVGALLAKTFPQLSLEVWLRLLTIFASVGTVIVLGLLAGLLPAFVFAVLPYSVYYGRSILPDPHMVFWAMFSLWLLSKNKTILAGIAAALALLFKPMAAFILLPALWYLWKKPKDLVMYSIITGVPLLLWRKWIMQFPEGIPVSTWLLNGNGIRFKGAWFHWLFATRLGDLILGFWGLIPFGLGLAGNFFFWVLGPLLYFIVFASGNVQHDYYQILIIPAVAVCVGVGLRRIPWYLATISFIFMLAFSWFTIRTYYWINRPEIVEAGKVADSILPKDAKVIAPYNGDTTFLYQTQRQGWPLGFDIDKKIAMGATAYVTVSPTDADGETRDLAQKYTVLVRNDKYAIIDLTRPASPPGGPKK